jgi:hypothetical protein
MSSAEGREHASEAAPALFLSDRELAAVTGGNTLISTTPMGDKRWQLSPGGRVYTSNPYYPG